MSLLVQCIADMHLEYVRGKISIEAWDCLVATFESKGIAGQLYLKQLLLKIKLAESDFLEEHFVVFNSLVRQLKTSGWCKIKRDECCIPFVIAITIFI